MSGIIILQANPLMRQSARSKHLTFDANFTIHSPNVEGTSLSGTDCELQMSLKKAVIFGILGVFAALLAVSGAAFGAEPTGNFGWDQGVTQVAADSESFLNEIFIIITAITVFVIVVMGFIMVRFREKANPVPSKTTHHVGLEIAWTIVPVLILLYMVAPSFKGLFDQDIIKDSDMTIKATGYTWHWQYEYVGMEDQIDEIISKPLPRSETTEELYLLETNSPLVVPSGTKVKVLVTSDRNLHAFSMDPFWVKVDAIPGRINETWFEVFEGKEGTYYGQCAELCGINHYYMPIEIRVVTKDQFKTFVDSGGDLASLPPSEPRFVQKKTAAQTAALNK